MMDFVTKNGRLKPFRFWCQKVLPLVYDDSLSYYELLCKVVAYLNELAKTTNDNTDKINYYIKLFEDFMNTFDIGSYVSEKLDEMAEDGTLDDLIAESIANYEECMCSIIAEKHISGFMDGGAYIGDNKIVYYIHVDDSNTGTLVCFNRETYAELWSYNLELYHGNSVTYNSRLNRLYVAGCYSYDDVDTLINKVFEIDLDSPESISNIIELSRPCYSICYNESLNKYYACCYRGAVDGEANRIYVFDENFNEESYFDLKNFPARFGFSSQGAQLSLNNKIYVAFYSPDPIIYIWDLTGELHSVFKIPQIISGYKHMYELENILYDFDNNIVIIGGRCTSSISGLLSMVCFAETNLEKTIPIHPFNNGIFGQLSVTCFQKNLVSYEPANLSKLIRDFYDCTSLATYYNGRVMITMQANGEPVSGTTYIRSSDVVITGNGNSFNNLRLICSTARVEGVTITGYDVTSISNNKKGNVIAESSLLQLRSCTLNNSAEIYGIISTVNSNVSSLYNTFSNNQNKAYLLFGGCYYNALHDQVCLGANAGSHDPIILHAGTIIKDEITPLNYGQYLDGYVPNIIYAGCAGTSANSFSCQTMGDNVVECISLLWSEGNVYERIAQLKINLNNKTVQLLNVKQRQPDGTIVTFDRTGIQIMI